MITTDVRKRYLTDATFHHLVDWLRAAIDQAQYTPTEIREAAMLAQIMYEETHISRHVVFDREDILR